MFQFTKTLRKADQIRRFTIRAAMAGWDVTEEADSGIVRERLLHDWHRVERARRAIDVEVRQLRNSGWQEV